MVASLRSRAVLVALAVVLAPSVAAAHIQLTSPTPRSPSQKDGPCGPLNPTRGTNVTVFEPGATIEVRWNETINHPGHYRISFDLDGQDFVFPPTATGSTEGMPNVVKDLIADRAGGAYVETITLPNMACENCTLQLIQVMTDKPPYTVGAASDDLYFQCADIALRPSAAVDGGVDAAAAGPDAGSDSDGGVGATDLVGGCGCRTSHGQPAGLLLAAAVLGIARRRRRAA